jgi:hypothetical protein
MARTPRSTTPTRVVPVRVKQPGIVAELGRPETPEETAARKAENSRKHRANQTLRNLLWSLAASVALMLLLVVVVVRPEQPAPDPIDYLTVAAQAQPGIAEPLALPALPPEWKANSAELGQASDGISTWYIGFITPSTEFAALSQGIGANPTWLATLLDQKQPTGTETIDGVEWEVYDHREDEDPGNLAYAMVTEAGESTFVLYGTADTNEFRTLAASVDAEIAANADQGTSDENGGTSE